VKPQTTTNYQLGTVYKTNRFNADFDGYFIRSHNLPSPSRIPPPIRRERHQQPERHDHPSRARAYYYGVEMQGRSMSAAAQPVRQRLAQLRHL